MCFSPDLKIVLHIAEWGVRSLMNAYRAANSYSFPPLHVAILFFFFLFVLRNSGDVDVQLDTPTVALMCAARINILVHMCGDTLFSVQVIFFPDSQRAFEF